MIPSVARPSSFEEKRLDRLAIEWKLRNCPFNLAAIPVEDRVLRRKGVPELVVTRWGYEGGCDETENEKEREWEREEEEGVREIQGRLNRVLKERGATGGGYWLPWECWKLREGQKRASKRVRETALAVHQPITETRNELRFMLERCFAVWTLIRYGREKSTSLETDVFSIVKNSSEK